MAVNFKSFLDVLNTSLSKVFVDGNTAKGKRFVNNDDEWNVDTKNFLENVDNFIKLLAQYSETLKESLQEIDIETVESENDTLAVEMDVCSSSKGRDGKSKHDVKTVDIGTQTVDLSQDTASDINATELERTLHDEANVSRFKEEENLVQIKASKSEYVGIHVKGDGSGYRWNYTGKNLEVTGLLLRDNPFMIDRRITAFIEQKRQEVDDFNKREFCSLVTQPTGEGDSCARVDSIFVTSNDGKSHIKVSRVVNLYGPQTISGNQNRQSNPDNQANEEVTSCNSVSQGVEERLKNMENHLKIRKGEVMEQKDVFSRLKSLEERILYLEGLSPEYFDYLPFRRKKACTEKRITDYQQEQDLTLAEIDKKINLLQESLRNKSSVKQNRMSCRQ